MRTLGTVLVVGWSLFGCVAPDEGSVTIALEDADLGITSIRIDRVDTAEGRLATITGYNDHAVEVARPTVRTGIVFDPDRETHNIDDQREGREFIVTVGVERAELVLLHRSRETRDTIAVAPIAHFLALAPVAAAIHEEGLLDFATPYGGEERPYGMTCNSNRFPAFKTPTSSCCTYGTAHDQKIPDGANINKIGHRQYGTVCTMIGGGPCSGTGCSYGPCGATTPVVTGTTASVIFDPQDWVPNPALCGVDTNGTAPGGGTPLDYSGMSPPHPIMPGALATCPYISCFGMANPLLTRTLTLQPSTNTGASGSVSTGASTSPHPNVNVTVLAGNTGYGYFIDGLTVTVTATPSSAHSFAAFPAPCTVGAPGMPATCNVAMTSNVLMNMGFYCEAGFSCP